MNELLTDKFGTKIEVGNMVAHAAVKYMYNTAKMIVGLVLRVSSYSITVFNKENYNNKSVLYQLKNTVIISKHPERFKNEV